MNTLRRRQQQLLQYLLGDDRSGIDRHVTAQGALGPQLCLAIYRNAYRMRLRETLDTDHPQLGRYLGDALYEQMVAGYIDAYPSRYRSLRQFANRLPQFLQATAPFSQHPQIAELARFERLLLTAFDAADRSRASAAMLSQIPAADWPGLTLRFHPSLQLFRSDYNVVAIWQALKAEQPPPAAVIQASTWVLWRNRERLTEFVSLSASEHGMLRLFLSGAPLAEAAEALLEQVPPAAAGRELLRILQQWLRRGWVQCLQPAAAGPDLSPVT